LEPVTTQENNKMTRSVVYTKQTGFLLLLGPHRPHECAVQVRTHTPTHAPF